MGHAVVITAILVNLSDAPPPLVDAAKDEAVALFAEIGIALRWVDDTDRGAGPGVWRVVVLPAAPRPVLTFDAGVLGSTASHALRTPVAWLFFKEIQRMAWRRHVPVRALLSRAIAHEVGHLLQEAKAHTASGLMRSHWHAKDFKSLAQGGLRFTPEDVASFGGQLPRRQMITTRQ